MSVRERDAMIAHLFFDWRWVEGEGPIRLGLASSHWLLPSGKDLKQVSAEEAETLNLYATPATFSIKALPKYSTDIGAAWALVEGYDQVDLRLQGGEWVCTLRFQRPAPSGKDSELVEASARAESAPLAICRAAYKATRVG